MEALEKLNTLILETRANAGVKMTESKAIKLLRHYDNLKAYLETKPRLEFLKAQEGTLFKKMDEIRHGYESFKFCAGKHLAPKKRYGAYVKSTGLLGLKKQHKNLKFLISLFQ